MIDGQSFMGIVYALYEFLGAVNRFGPLFITQGGQRRRPPL